MKKIISLTVLFMAFAVIAKAQVCKILISYDDSGNRIKREKSCVGNRPENPADSVNLAAQGIGGGADKALGPVGLFEIYPNPTANQVNVRLDAISLQSACSLIITDATGKALSQRSLKDPVTTIGLNGYTDGTYFFMLYRGSSVNTVKIVKEYSMGRN
ncbi:T9SS type A sorting domain-containing protein [Taibaiella koreensis]|uniref:T9SS type A sorting domain-containing protein n=1 Tax=Taibaiella koreensis TaxID=1268548 RepID=UPI000E59E149|nr:T9SS type A sorting domain-containing protein [Taibaiella koreensis]